MNWMVTRLNERVLIVSNQSTGRPWPNGNRDPEHILYRSLTFRRNGLTGGSFLGASAVVVHGIGDLAILEAMACREALALVQDLQLTMVKIASDCQIGRASCRERVYVLV